MHIIDKKLWIGALLALGLAACATEQASEREVGRLEVPLLTTAADGTLYALAGGFSLEGPESLNFDARFDQGNSTDPSAVLEPRVGTYELSLSWVLYRVTLDAAGEFATMEYLEDAQLLSPVSQQVVITAGATTYVTYRFSVPGSGEIEFARGTLVIDFEVEEGFAAGAACTTDIECASHVCQADGFCAAATCDDGVLNGDETTPDCGPSCPCGGGASACGAAEAAQCAAGDTCQVVGGVVQCFAGGFEPVGTPCNATQAQSCPAGATCAQDGMGGIICSVGLTSGTPCTSNEQCASVVCLAATNECQ
jgi:hypothetical protein